MIQQATIFHYASRTSCHTAHASTDIFLNLDNATCCSSLYITQIFPDSRNHDKVSQQTTYQLNSKLSISGAAGSNLGREAVL